MAPPRIFENSSLTLLPRRVVDFNSMWLAHRMGFVVVVARDSVYRVSESENPGSPRQYPRFQSDGDVASVLEVNALDT